MSDPTKPTTASTIGALVFLGFLFLFAHSCCKDMAAADTGTHQMSREEQIQRSFSVFNGAHRELEKTVKAALDDPTSYKHVETTYNDNGDHLMVKMKFRAANKYGMSVLNTVYAKTDVATGQVIEVKAWE